MFRHPRPAPAVLAVLAALMLAAPVAAQSGPSAQREAAEDALADAQALAEGEGVRTGRELTTALLEVSRKRNALSRSDRQEADRLLARPTDAADGGVGGPYSTSARVLRSCSAHFCVHWVDSTADAPPQANADSCASPDYVDKVVRALEESRTVENGHLRWLPPVSDGSRGGNALTDVYLKDLNDNTGGLYGYAATEGGSGSTRPAYMVLENDFTEPAFDDYGGDPTIPIEATAAHEYNHVLQYAYDIGQDDWMYESTATWAEEKVFPDSPDWHGYVDDWAAQPNKPLTSPSGLKMYGSAIWNHWLEQRYGADVVKRAWEQSVASGLAPKAYDLAIKAETTGTSLEANFGDFAAATAEWTAANSGIRDGTQFTDVVARENPVVPLIPGDSGATIINHTGFRLFDVDTTGSDPLELTASLRTAPGNGAAGTIALVGIGPSGVTKVVARTGTTGANATVTLDDPSRFTGITAVIANADYRNSGFSTVTRDWIWSRDNESATFSVAQDSDATPSEEEDPEPLDPDPAGTPPDTTCATTSVEREPTVTVEPTPTASATPTVTPTPTPTPRTTVGLTRSSTRLATIARKGVLSFFARTNKAGRLTAGATVDRATAVRLKVGRRTTSAGTAQRTFRSPARLKINVRLTRKVRAALKRHRGKAVRVKVAVAFTPDDGTGTVRRTFTLRLRR